MAFLAQGKDLVYSFIPKHSAGPTGHLGSPAIPKGVSTKHESAAMPQSMRSLQPSAEPAVFPTVPPHKPNITVDSPSSGPELLQRPAAPASSPNQDFAVSEVSFTRHSPSTNAFSTSNQESLRAYQQHLQAFLQKSDHHNSTRPAPPPPARKSGAGVRKLSYGQSTRLALIPASHNRPFFRGGGRGRVVKKDGLQEKQSGHDGKVLDGLFRGV